MSRSTKAASSSREGRLSDAAKAGAEAARRSSRLEKGSSDLP